jgi:uncharacterized protein YlzI (FlbEa/FlbD family)
MILQFRYWTVGKSAIKSFENSDGKTLIYANGNEFHVRESIDIVKGKLIEMGVTSFL